MRQFLADFRKLCHHDFIALALLGLLVTGLLVAFVPSFINQFMSRVRTEMAVNSLITAFHEAHDLAIHDDSTVQLFVDEGLGIIEVEGGGYYRLPPHIHLAGPEPDDQGRGIIRFYPDGKSDASQIIVSNDQLAWDLFIPPLTLNKNQP